MQKTWLITGCSSGLGRELVEAALARGDRVVATARNPRTLDSLAAKYPDTVRTKVLDVTQPGAAATAVALAEQAFGRLDVLVNNAGFAFIGAVEEGTPEEYRPMFETNVFGLVETTRVALPALRRAGGGRIVNISSIAGVVAWAGSGLYAATKFAVEGISESLAQEVAPFGIGVIIVEPGAFRTELLSSSFSMAKTELPDYAETSGKARVYARNGHGKQAGDPKKAVAVILQAVDADAPPLHLPLGKQAYAQARAKLASFAQTMDAWEAVAAATEYDP